MRYTEAQRTEAVNLALELEDVAEAARRLDISRQLLHQWLQKAGLTVNTANREANIQAARMRWEERRQAMTDRLGYLAGRALDALEGNLEADEIRNTKDLATTAAILIDKAQLLSGSATSRVYVPPERAGEVMSDARARGLSLVTGTD